MKNIKKKEKAVSNASRDQIQKERNYKKVVHLISSFQHKRHKKVHST